MSPEKFIKINGSRPSPLRISKDSHAIHKLSDHHHHQHQQQQVKQRQQPVIIYTHSPKIIHTQARDFMALVQKLTGMSRDDNHETIIRGSDQLQANSNSSSEVKADNNESSTSVVTEEINGGVSNNGGNRNYAVSNPSFADVPLFTPSSSMDFNLFCSPRPAFRFPDPTLSSPNLGSPSLSPSFLEFMKGLPEY